MQMKIINLLYSKYILSLSICLISSSVIFFIFSLLGNLDEEYLFNVIMKISFYNSLQILTYVPSFIFLLSVILFTIFLRSKNEMIIVKSYMNIKMLAIFFLPIVIFFSILELNKKDVGLLVEDLKRNLIKDGIEFNTKIIINNNSGSKSYIILKNINSFDNSNAEYRYFDLKDKKIKLAQFSNNLIYSNNTLIAKSYTQYKDDIINDYQISRSFNFNFGNFIDQNFVVKDISKRNKTIIDKKIINTFLFFILFFSYVFLVFLNKNSVSTKYSLKKPIFVSLTILIYSFFIFNNSLSFYKQEFEFLGSIIAILFFFKVYMNE